MRSSNEHSAPPPRPRRAAALFAAALETLESRRLLCADHFIGGAANPLAQAYDPTNPNLIDTRVVVKTNGFQPAGDTAVAAAAAGMPDLNSRPGAPTAIFLDFDGDTGTSTNPYDDDANPTTFSVNEAAIITAAWEEMSVYFGMFDVNITTTQPAASMPTAWVAIGNNISGGYSEVGPFPNTGSKAHSWTASGFAHTRVSGIAHEIGHNFGLQHQSDYSNLGVKVNEYSSGWDLLHGPIIGVDFAQNVHKWFIGHNAVSAPTLQDDLAVIANRIKPYQPPGGDGYRVDDFGDTIAAASTLTLSGTTYSGSGVIERVTDVDAFAFNVTSAATPTQISALPRFESAVDLKLGLYDSSGTLLAMRDSGTNGQDLALTLQPGTYYALLSSHGNYGDQGMYDVAVNALPGGWQQQDIGPIGAIGGSATYDAPTSAFNIAADTASMNSTSDYFRYYFRTLTGDGTITARVDSIAGGSTSSRAGILLRETLDTNSKFGYAFATTAGNVGFEFRSSTGGNVTGVSQVTGVGTPVWLRITRTGSILSAARSPDGVSWTTLGTQTISMGSSVTVGMMANSNQKGEIVQAAISNVAITGNTTPPPPVYNALPAPTGVSVAPQSNGSGMVVSWTDIAGDSGYVIERSSDGVTFATVGSALTNATSFFDSVLPGSLRYFYRVTTRDAVNGRSVPSETVHGLNRPSAVTNMKALSINASQVIVDWRDIDGESGYRVERSSDNGLNWTTLATVAANVPTYTATGLTQGTTYYFRVTPTSSIGDGVANQVSGQSRLSPVTGFAFTSIATNQIRLAWNGNVPFATGYRIERSTNNTTFTTLANVAGATASSYTDSTVAQLTKYFYRIVATNSFTESTTVAILRAATPSATPLPLGWGTTDIGAGTAPGASGFAGTTATVIGSGAIISGTGVDKLHYLFQRATGDGDFIARVASHETTSSVIGAGIMIRASLSDSSNYVHLRATSVGMDMLRRGGTISTTHINVNAPLWFKLTRSAATITGYYSTDGVAWTLVGTSNDAIPAGSAITIGLTTTPQDTTALATATFNQISGALVNQPDAAAPAAPAFSAISTDTGSSAIDRITSDNTLILTGAAEAASWVTISRSDIGIVGTVQANYLGSFSFDYTGVALADGAYTFTASAKDASNNISAASTPFAVTIDTVAPTPASWTFNLATQRVEIVYSEPLNAATVSAVDVGLNNVTTSQSFSVTSAGYNTLTRTGSYGTSSALIDGHWRATLNAAAISDPAGNLLAGPYNYDFYYASGTAGADAYTIRVIPGGASFEISEGAQLHTVTRAGLQRIFLNPLGGTDSLDLDFSAGIDWMPPQGLAIGAMEAARITGGGTGAGAQTFTFAGNTLSSGGWNLDMTPIQSLALAAGAFTITGDLAGRALAADAAAALDVRASLRLASLAITGGALVDLNDNDLAMRTTPLATIENFIRTGSLTSSLIDEGFTVLGTAPAGAAFGLDPGQTTLFSGLTVVAEDILVKYTYGGDANLDGLVDAADYGMIDNWIQFPGSSGYFNGDFNYDGVIDAADYGIIDNNIQLQDPPL